jgi:hypothetical protein
MAWATLNGASVIYLRLLVPRVGAWLADVTIDAEQLPDGPVLLGLEEGAATWKGTVVRRADAFGRIIARVVGGGGGLGKRLPGKSYRNVAARVVFADVLGQAGEKLSPQVAPALLGFQLAAWSRATGAASTQLLELLGTVAPSAAWRILPDGTWWAGTETWPAASLSYELMARRPAEGTLVVATSELSRLLPGRTLEGERVSAVEHVVDADRMRSVVWLEQ